jgi:hypothetical protein
MKSSRFYATLFVAIFFYLTGQHGAKADELTVQVSPDSSTGSAPGIVISLAPSATSDTATVTSPVQGSAPVSNPQPTQQQNSTTGTPQSATLAIASVQSKIETATVALSSAVTSAAPASATVAATPIAEAHTAIVAATTAVETATVTAQSAATAVVLVAAAQASVDTATAVVVDKTAVVALATQTVTNTQTTLTTAQEAQPVLDAAASCAPGSACVNFYNKNAELGPVHDQIAPAQAAADAAVAAVPVAQTVVEVATTNVANQQSAVDAATAASTAAKAAAEASSVTVTTNGVKASAYTYNGGAAPAIPDANATPVLTTTVPYISASWGSGVVLGVRSDRVIIKYEGTITVPEEAVAVKYGVYSDDGSKLYIDGQLAINNWRDQGPTWSQFSPTYNTTTDKQQDFILWYYENGGGANVTLGWGITRADGTGYWTNPMNTAFATTVVTKDPVLVAVANTASATFVAANQQLTSAQTSLATATQTLTSAQAAVPVTSQAAADAQAAYDTKLAERNAAYESWQNAIHAANTGTATIAQAQTAYDQAQQDLATAKQNLVVAQQNLTKSQENLTVIQATAQTLTTATASAITTADQFAESAVTKVTVAVSAIQTAEKERFAAEAKALADKKAADELAAKQAADKAAADAAKAAAAAAAVPSSPEPLPTPVEQPSPMPEPSPEPSPVLNPDPSPTAPPVAPEPAPVEQPAPVEEPAPVAPEPQPEPPAQPEEPPVADPDTGPDQPPVPDVAPVPEEIPTPQPDPAPEPETPADPPPTPEGPPPAPEPAPAPAPEPPVVIEVTKDTTAETWKPAVAPETYLTKTEIKAFEAIGLVPNNPAQLPTDIPKPAPAEILIPHIQVDVTGVENGGIQFFGTQTAPQVVGEDGNLTPPAPAPGSGDPIPPEAITTEDTFIGQPGGTTFNAPDIAVPVELVPVELPAALDVLPGVGAAAQAINQAYVALANIGNDMSPVTRKKAKKILVITVVVAAIRRRFN